jgi:hypothetical protein
MPVNVPPIDPEAMAGWHRDQDKYWAHYNSQQGKLERAGFLTSEGKTTPDGARWLQTIASMPDESRELALDQYLEKLITVENKLTDKGRVLKGGRRAALDSPEGYAAWEKYGFEPVDNRDGLTKVMSGLGTAVSAIASVPGAARLAFRDKSKMTEQESREALLLADEFGKEVASNWSFLKHAPGWLFGDMEGKRKMELAQAMIEEADAGIYASALMDVGAGNADLRDLMHAQRAVAKAREEASPEEVAQADKRALGVALVGGDPADWVLDGLFAGVGKGAALGARQAAAMTRLKPLLRAEKTLELAQHGLANLERRKAHLSGVARNGRTKQERLLAQGELRKLDDLKVDLQENAFQAQRAAAHLQRGGATSQAARELSETGRWVGSLAPRAGGAAVEKFGKLLGDAADKAKDAGVGGLLHGAAQAARFSPVVAGGFIGGPVGAAVGAGMTGMSYMSKGRLIQAAGRNLRVLGQEFRRSQSTVPFWKRVAEHANSSPWMRAAARGIDWGDSRLGISDQIKGAGAGAAAGGAAGFVLSGGDLEAAGMGMAPGTLYGAVGGQAGAVTKTTKRAHQAAQLVDWENFKASLPDKQQLVRFNRLQTDEQRLVSHYNAVFPDIEVRFEDSGGGRYDSNTNTVYINPRANNPLKPLISHEVGHYIVEQGLGGPVSMRVLDLVKENGEFTQSFKDFRAAYNARMKRDGNPPLADPQVALEYAIESYVDELMGIAKSGELGRMASGRDKMLGAFLEDSLPATPILGRFFRHSGTLYDASGKVVPGSGVSTKGVMRDPAIQKMMREHTRRLAGRSAKNLQRVDPKTGETMQQGGIAYRDWINDKSMHERVRNIFEQDDKGNIIYRNGKPVLRTTRDINKQDKALGNAIVGAVEKLDEQTISNLPEGHIKFDEDSGQWVGRYLADDVLADIEGAKILNERQLADLRMMNDTLKADKGDLWSVINQPAIKTGKTGSKRYASLSPSMDSVVPFGISVTQKGNVLLHLVNIDKVNDNATQMLKRKRGKDLYGNAPDAVMRDVKKHMENWRDGVDNVTYWQQQDGDKKLGRMRHEFLNAVAGDTGTVKQKQANPFVQELKSKEGKTQHKYSTVKTYRWDRINNAVRLQDGAWPYSYEMHKAGLLPSRDPNPPGEARRLKSSEAVPLGIEGPSGAVLDSYQWEWQWDVKFSESEGGLIDAKVSDWTKAEASASTGRDLVHKFLLRKDGETRLVSLETALREMGFLSGTEGTKSARKVVSNAKTLAKNKVKLAVLEGKRKARAEFISDAKEKPHDVTVVPASAASLKGFWKRRAERGEQFSRVLIDGVEVDIKENSEIGPHWLRDNRASIIESWAWKNLPEEWKGSLNQKAESLRKKIAKQERAFAEMKRFNQQDDRITYPGDGG